MASTDTSCGYSFCRPSFLQRFASSRVFIVVFGCLGTIQGMAFIYFIATLTTLEKRFQLPSETMGILMSGNEVSQILLVLILSYLGGKGNRPVWIAWGVAVSALSCFILTSPHFFYGAGEAALALTAEYLDASVLNASSGGKEPFVCSPMRQEKECSAADIQHSIIPMILLFTSQFVLGIGTSLYFSLGQTYMDDNTKKTKTPMLLGITMALRTFGPACGFLLGSACLSMYIDPSLTPLIERKDPRWLGAWWLGWVILGGAMLVISLILGSFPKTLPKKQVAHLQTMQMNPIYEGKDKAEDDSLFTEYNRVEELSSKERRLSEVKPLKGQPKESISFKGSLFRIITNPLLMVNNFVAVFYILGASGYMNFYTKYTETQFNASAATSNAFAAFSTISSLVAGFLISGFVISRFQPRTSYLLMWNILIGCVYVGGELFLMTLECQDSNIQGNVTEIGTLNPRAMCNADCACDSIRYSPVCDLSTNTSFFSACHAGCTSMQINEAGQRIFGDCSCLANATAAVSQGPCPRDCGSTFYTFMFAVGFMQMMGCTGRITNVLINYRSVLPQDKSIAQGLALMLISLFAFIPGPILFGKIIDNACLIWDNTCGKRGNCWFYDKTRFRVYLNATAACFSMVALILDVALWFLGRKIDLFEDLTQPVPIEDDDERTIRKK